MLDLDPDKPGRSLRLLRLSHRLATLATKRTTTPLATPATMNPMIAISPSLIGQVWTVPLVP
jgi:hypothetical protein